MAKGSGSGGSRGSGGTGGRGGSGASLQRLIASKGGLHATEYARSGMRDLSFARSHYAGKTPAQANRLARTSAYPVRVHVEHGKGGAKSVHLNDGRHRMTAAREAGATHIRATVVEYGPRGGVIRRWTGIVKL